MPSNPQPTSSSLSPPPRADPKPSSTSTFQALSQPSSHASNAAQISYAERARKSAQAQAGSTTSNTLGLGLGANTGSGGAQAAGSRSKAGSVSGSSSNMGVEERSVSSTGAGPSLSQSQSQSQSQSSSVPMSASGSTSSTAAKSSSVATPAAGVGVASVGLGVGRMMVLGGKGTTGSAGGNASASGSKPSVGEKSTKGKSAVLATSKAKGEVQQDKDKDETSDSGEWQEVPVKRKEASHPHHHSHSSSQYPYSSSRNNRPLASGSGAGRERDREFGTGWGHDRERGRGADGEGRGRDRSAGAGMEGNWRGGNYHARGGEGGRRREDGESGGNWGGGKSAHEGGWRNDSNARAGETGYGPATRSASVSGSGSRAESEGGRDAARANPPGPKPTIPPSTTASSNTSSSGKLTWAKIASPPPPLPRTLSTTVPNSTPPAAQTPPQVETCQALVSGTGSGSATVTKAAAILPPSPSLNGSTTTDPTAAESSSRTSNVEQEEVATPTKMIADPIKPIINANEQKEAEPAMAVAAVEPKVEETLTPKPKAPVKNIWQARKEQMAATMLPKAGVPNISRGKEGPTVAEANKANRSVFSALTSAPAAREASMGRVDSSAPAAGQKQNKEEKNPKPSSASAKLARTTTTNGTPPGSQPAASSSSKAGKKESVAAKALNIQDKSAWPDVQKAQEIVAAKVQAQQVPAEKAGEETASVAESATVGTAGKKEKTKWTAIPAAEMQEALDKVTRQRKAEQHAAKKAEQHAESRKKRTATPTEPSPVDKSAPPTPLDAKKANPSKSKDNSSSTAPTSPTTPAAPEKHKKRAKSGGAADAVLSGAKLNGEPKQAEAARLQSMDTQATLVDAVVSSPAQASAGVSFGNKGDDATSATLRSGKQDKTVTAPVPPATSPAKTPAAEGAKSPRGVYPASAVQSGFQPRGDEQPQDVNGFANGGYDSAYRPDRGDRPARGGGRGGRGGRGARGGSFAMPQGRSFSEQNNANPPQVNNRSLSQPQAGAQLLNSQYPQNGRFRQNNQTGYYQPFPIPANGPNFAPHQGIHPVYPGYPPYEQPFMVFPQYPVDNNSFGVAPFPQPVTQINGIDGLQSFILGQLEYYFSMNNLAMDFFLRQQMDAHGWVSIPTISGFNRIKSLTTDEDLVEEVAGISSLLEVRESHIRLSNGQWRQWILPNAKSSPFPEIGNEPHPEMTFPNIGGADLSSSARSKLAGDIHRDVMRQNPSPNLQAAAGLTDKVPGGLEAESATSQGPATDGTLTSTSSPDTSIDDDNNDPHDKLEIIL